MVARIALAVGLMAVTPISPAQTSEHFALSARAAWSAYECAYLADMLGDDASQKRFEAYGYSKGKVFLAAYTSGRIRKADIESTVPSDFLGGFIDGPSPDFKLGRLYESIRNSVSREVLEDDDFHISDSERLRINLRYRKGNCTLIGTGSL